MAVWLHVKVRWRGLELWSRLYACCLHVSQRQCSRLWLVTLYTCYAFTFYFMPCSINGGRSLNLQTVGNRNFRNKILTILKVTETHDWKTLLLYLLVYVTRKKQTPFRFLAVSIACCVYAGINLRKMSSHPLQAYIQYSSVALWLLAFVRNFNMWLWFIVIIFTLYLSVCMNYI